MKQEQLKKLAKWYGLEKISSGSPEPDCYNKNDFYVDVDYWQPHKDSNQLDMLEDKMIKEYNIYKFIVWDREEDERMRVYYYGRYMDLEIRGIGETKNEARLNAILNYVENK